MRFLLPDLSPQKISQPWDLFPILKMGTTITPHASGLVSPLICNIIVTENICPLTNPQPIRKSSNRNIEFYLARMQASKKEASAATLPNVRERALRAAATWKELYEKAELFEQRQQR